MPSDSGRRQPKAPFTPVARPAPLAAPVPSASPSGAPPEPGHRLPKAVGGLVGGPETPSLGKAAGSLADVHRPAIARPSRSPAEPGRRKPEQTERPLEFPPSEPFWSRRWWMGLAFLAVVGAVAVWLGRPAYQNLKTWRAHAFVGQAEILMRQEKWTEAVQKAMAAYHLSPLDERTLRLAARLCAHRGQREAILFWENLILTGKATGTDRRDLAEFALKNKELGVASRQVEWLLKSEPETFPNLKLAAEFFFHRGDAAKAKDYCRKALVQEPAHHGLQVLFARLLARSNDVAEQVEARRTMRILGGGVDEDSLEALGLLARMANLPREDAELAAERLARHPLAKTQHHLLAAELRLRWHPEQRQSLLAQAIERYQKTTDADLLALGRWLNRLGEFQRTLAGIPPASAARHQDLFLVRLDALAALRRWTDVKGALEEAKCPLEPVLKNLFFARAAKELGNEDEAAAFWRRVHLEATDRPAAWLYLAQYAERIGNKAEAAKAWRRLAKDPELGRLAYEALIRLAEQEGNTRVLRELMTELARLFPQELAPRNDLAYLNLLLKENATSARETSRKLVEENPSFLAYRTTLALAHLRLNEVAAAAALYEGVNLDWGAVLPGWQAVRVAVLGANGRTNLARVAAKRIPLGSLKPEERELILPYL